MLTPPLKASLMAQRKANSMNATKMDSNVSVVRSFLRFRLPQTRGRNFMPGVVHAAGWSDSWPLSR